MLDEDSEHDVSMLEDEENDWGLGCFPPKDRELYNSAHFASPYQHTPDLPELSSRDEPDPEDYSEREEPRPCIYGCDLRTVYTSEWQLQKHINIAHSSYQPTRCRYPGCKSTQLIETEVSYGGHFKKIHQLRGDQQELYTVGLRNKELPTLEKPQDHRRDLTRRCIALCMP